MSDSLCKTVFVQKVLSCIFETYPCVMCHRGFLTRSLVSSALVDTLMKDLFSQSVVVDYFAIVQLIKCLQFFINQKDCTQLIICEMQIDTY